MRHTVKHSPDSRLRIATLALVAALAVIFCAQAASADIYVHHRADGSVAYTDTPTDPAFEMHIREDAPVLPWREYARIQAERFDLDPKLVRAVIYVESNESAGAVSHAGAMGLMQLMPGTADELGVEEPMRPRENIKGGVLYLAQMMERFDNNVKLALAAYNAGPGAVEKYGGIPPYKETQNYVRKVLYAYENGVDE